MPNISYTEDPKRLRQTVKILKTIAANPDIPIEEV
jgi:hypothetical protein